MSERSICTLPPVCSSARRLGIGKLVIVIRLGVLEGRARRSAKVGVAGRSCVELLDLASGC